jgi:hypothetical protein
MKHYPTRIKFFLIPLMISLAFASSALATTYYVDNSCSNNGNGQGQSCASSAAGVGPFNSLANAQSMWTGNQSGNMLLFRKGQTFTGQFTVGAYGTEGNVATISSYGSGPQPIISGGSSCIYLNDKNYVTVAGINVKSASGSWGAGLYATSCDHVVFQNCTVDDSAGAETFSIYFVNCRNCTANSNTVTNPTGYNGIGIHGGTSHTGNTISNNIVSNVRITGIYTSGAYGNRLNQAYIYGNESYGCKAGMYLNWTDNSEIHHNYIHDNKGAGPEGEPYGIGAMSCSNNLIYNNRIGNNNNKGLDIYGDTGGTYGSATGNKVYNNYVYDHTQGQGCGLHTSSPDGAGISSNEFYYNILVGNTNGITSDASSSSTGLTYYNNTFHGNGVGLNFYRNPGATVKNNIFSENASYGLRLGSTATSIAHSNNLYFKTGGGNVVYWNGTTYNVSTAKSTFETSCQNTDPNFASSSDLHLQSSSPCINGGTPVGLTQDYEGKAISGLPAIGAYEYTTDAGISPPQNLRIAQ